MTAVTIFVCVSCRCRLGEDDDSFDQPGRGLAQAIEAHLLVPPLNHKESP
jgi:predicted metal-binding protein